MKREIVLSKSKEGAILFGCSYWVDVIDTWLKSIGSGTYVLKLEKKQSQRTLSQNALMWVWFDAIAKEFTEATDKYYNRDCVKEFFCRKYLPLELPNGEVVGGSTSGLTTEQMSEFMEKVQAYAATEWGISLLNPEDKMFDQWRNQYE
jgi:hypothetical protein